MRKTNYDINGMSFKSKKELKRYIREKIYNIYPDYEPLSDDHFHFMMAMLRFHPWSQEKIGVGVKSMWIQPNKPYPTRSFWLKRIDGTQTDFSYLQCTEKPNHFKDFRDACRRAIAPLVIEFSRHHFQENKEAICPVLGIQITRSDSHVDHMPPNTFEKIVSEFIEERGVKVEEAPLAEHDDGKIGNWFNDKEFEHDWIEFHNKRATLRVISREANLGMKRPKIKDGVIGKNF